MLSVCISLTGAVFNFSFTATTDVPICLWVRMARGMEHKSNKYLYAHTKKEHQKKLHNNWKCISLWWNVFREWWASRSASLGCATVHTVQTEVINHTKTDFVQKQKPACATQHLVTLQNIFSRSVHTDILWCDGEYQQLVHPATSCLRVWFPWTETPAKLLDTRRTHR